MCAIFITQILLLAVFSSCVVQTLVSASCVIFSSLNVGTHCVHVVAQLVNFSVQSLNVRRQRLDRENLHYIDTGAVFGGELTLLQLQ